MLKRVLIVPLFLIGIITGCKKDSTTATTGVPNVSVNFTVDVDAGGYANLLVAGGWMYVSGGYDGILLYCQTPGNYIAYDRGCPYDCETNAKAIITVQTGGITAVCPVCGTTYSMLNGTITKGPGSIALKQYQTNFDGTNLTVSN
jgi:nitrite reductase/ring-hydroxylating ferredoxin subunit